MPVYEGKKSKENADIIVLGKTTNFNGILKFKSTIRVQGKIKGTIDAAGALIVDKGAIVEADRIKVSSLTVYGTVTGAISAKDKVDIMSGAQVRGNLTAARLRIADGVIFEGHCNMAAVDKEVDIFSRPIEEIKEDLYRRNE